MTYHHTVSWCKGHEEQTNECLINPHNEMPKTQPKLQVKRMEEKRLKNSMPKDTVEVMVSKTVKQIHPQDLGTETGRVENILREALTTAYNKGVEAERERILTTIAIHRGNLRGEEDANIVLFDLQKALTPLPEVSL